MTMDETISYLDSMAKQNEELCQLYHKSGDAKMGDDLYGADAKMYRQLAEWLRELKKWRALRDSINMLCDVDCVCADACYHWCLQCVLW